MIHRLKWYKDYSKLGRKSANARKKKKKERTHVSIGGFVGIIYNIARTSVDDNYVVFILKNFSLRPIGREFLHRSVEML